MTLTDLEKLEALHAAGELDPFPVTAKALREAWKAWKALDEREGDMHARIRAGYDTTVADSWRDHCARIEKERDEALEALEAIVLNCRYGCNRDSNCGVCALALKVLPNGWPTQSEDE